MPEVETISWEEMTGNKFTINLHPAMLSDDGYVVQRSIRRIGDIVPTVFNVVHDREYAIGFIGRKICKTLQVLGKQKILELVDEAWDTMYPNSTEAKANRAKAS